MRRASSSASCPARGRLHAGRAARSPWSAPCGRQRTRPHPSWPRRPRAQPSATAAQDRRWWRRRQLRQLPRRDGTGGRRTQRHVHAQQRTSSRMLLHETARIEPCPTSDQHADVAIGRPALIDFNCADRSRLAQPVGELGEQPLGVRPAFAPVLVLRHTTRQQQQGTRRFADRRRRSTAGLTRTNRFHHLRRRQDAADDARTRAKGWMSAGRRPPRDTRADALEANRRPSATRERFWRWSSPGRRCRQRAG